MHVCMYVCAYVSMYVLFPASSVGIATDYGMDGPEIDRPIGPPNLLYNGHRVFPGGKVRPGRAADHSPPSSAELLEE
jgi:hypothetical protein